MRHFLILLLLVSIMTSVSCSLDNDDNSDFTGLWETSGAFKGLTPPPFWNIVDLGSRAYGNCLFCPMSGSCVYGTLTLTGKTFEGHTYVLTAGLLDAETLSGTLTALLDGGGEIKVDITLKKIGNPTGRFTCEGQMDGIDLSLDSSSAFGVTNSSGLVGRSIAHLGADNTIALILVNDSVISKGHNVINEQAQNPGEVGVLLRFWDNDTFRQVVVETGSVTITRITDDVIAGSFQIDSFKGVEGSASGTFMTNTLIVEE